MVIIFTVQQTSLAPQKRMVKCKYLKAFIVTDSLIWSIFFNKNELPPAWKSMDEKQVIKFA